ncbi:MAG: hypothetical protein LBC41_03950 [Clostridiales bacterium]|nr:hypothetical protein [Clostridiales bacterium]MDR2749794.1 hypothetical protein [Clostridiales bacterium]
MIKRVPFDFRNNFKESFDMLSYIIVRSSWHSYLDLEDYHTELLIKLLHRGGIAVYESRYENADSYSDEVRRKADRYASIMRKKVVSEAILNMVNTFPDLKHDDRTMLNAPFFPELNAYMRCDGIKPDDLLCLLKQDYCKTVLVFPYYDLPDSKDEWALYAFILEMPRDEYLEEIRKADEDFLKIMGEALERATAGVFKTPLWTPKDSD